MGDLWRSSKPSLFVLSQTCSVLYLQLIIAIYISIMITRLTGDPAHPHNVEPGGLMMYLYLISIIYLSALLLYFSRPQHSQHHNKSHGSAFLRQGAAVFGLGSCLYSGLESTVISESIFTSCYDIVDVINAYLLTVFIILQMITVICYPRLNIRMKHGLSHLGLMHLISTNSIIWMRTIVKESIFEYHEINEENGESNSDWLEMKPLDLEPWYVAHMSSHQTTYPTNISHHSEKTFAIDTLDPDQENFGCYENSAVMANNIIYKVLKESTPVLFPFIIEFSLIGCTMFFSMWKHVGFKQDSLDIYSLNIKRYIQNIDWSNSLRGFLLGLFVLALNIINLSLFFTMQDARDNTDEYIAKLINTFINLVGIGGCIVASYKIQKLKDKKIDDGFDSVLLSLSGFFLILYSLLEITVGVYGFQSKSTTMVRHSIQVFNGVLSTLATLVQIVFINLTLTKGTVLERNGSDSTDDLDSVDVSARPGRNEILFLAILNFSQWLVFTFEMQKSQSSKTESEYFGRYAWVIIQRVTLPLCIFFRFHSTILLIDAWKNNYKTEIKGEFH